MWKGGDDITVKTLERKKRLLQGSLEKKAYVMIGVCKFKTTPADPTGTTTLGS